MNFRYPSIEELHALERAARRARAAEVERLARSALAGVKGLLVRSERAIPLKGARHA